MVKRLSPTCVESGDFDDLCDFPKERISNPFLFIAHLQHGEHAGGQAAELEIRSFRELSRIRRRRQKPRDAPTLDTSDGFLPPRRYMPMIYERSALESY